MPTLDNQTLPTVKPQKRRSRGRPARPSQEMTLAQMRESKGVTQKEMALRLNLQQSNISRIEARGDMQLSTLHAYLNALDLSMDISVKIGHHVIVLKIEETRGNRSSRQEVLSKPFVTPLTLTE